MSSHHPRLLLMQCSRTAPGSDHTYRRCAAWSIRDAPRCRPSTVATACRHPPPIARTCRTSPASRTCGIQRSASAWDSSIGERRLSGNLILPSSMEQPTQKFVQGKCSCFVLIDRMRGLRKRTSVCTQEMINHKKHSEIKALQSELAERKGFEPSRSFHLYALSRGAPSTTRPPLRAAPLARDNKSIKRFLQNASVLSNESASPVRITLCQWRCAGVCIRAATNRRADSWPLGAPVWCLCGACRIERLDSPGKGRRSRQLG